MFSLQWRFAETTETAEGIGAFNINLKAFLFQLLTFIIVLAILRKWAFPKLIATMEERRKVLEKSLKQAKETELALASAEAKASDMLQKAREQADKVLREANTKSKEIITAAEGTAHEQAQRIVAEAQEKLGQEHLKLRDQLKIELADLVTLASQKVLRRKLNHEEDRRIVELAVKEIE